MILFGGNMDKKDKDKVEESEKEGNPCAGCTDQICQRGFPCGGKEE